MKTNQGPVASKQNKHLNKPPQKTFLIPQLQEQQKLLTKSSTESNTQNATKRHSSYKLKNKQKHQHFMKNDFEEGEREELKQLKKGIKSHFNLRSPYLFKKTSYNIPPFYDFCILTKQEYRK